MEFTAEQVKAIGKAAADEVFERVKKLQLELHERDMYLGMLMGEGAIPVHGRETRKAPCQACRINPEGPLEAGNIMATTEGAIGTLNQQEVKDWCSEIVEVTDGRCTRARRMSQLLRGPVIHRGEIQEKFKQIAIMH